MKNLRDSWWLACGAVLGLLASFFVNQVSLIFLLKIAIGSLVSACLILSIFGKKIDAAIGMIANRNRFVVGMFHAAFLRGEPRRMLLLLTGSVLLTLLLSLGAIASIVLSYWLASKGI